MPCFFTREVKRILNPLQVPPQAFPGMLKPGIRTRAGQVKQVFTQNTSPCFADDIFRRYSLFLKKKMLAIRALGDKYQSDIQVKRCMCWEPYLLVWRLKPNLFFSPSFQVVLHGNADYVLKLWNVGRRVLSQCDDALNTPILLKRNRNWHIFGALLPIWILVKAVCVSKLF